MKSTERVMIAIRADCERVISLGRGGPQRGVYLERGWWRGGTATPCLHSPFGALVGLVALFLGGLVSFPACAGEKNPNTACLDCHSGKALSKTNSLGKEISLFVDEGRFVGTVHATNSCSSCH